MAYCQHCGAQLRDDGAICAKCGCQNLSVGKTPDLSDSDIARAILPVGRTLLSIIAGYLGLLSLTLVLAPVSLGIGVWALYDLKKHPEKHGRGRAWFGAVMGAIFTGILLVLVLTA